MAADFPAADLAAAEEARFEFQYYFSTIDFSFQILIIRALFWGSRNPVQLLSRSVKRIALRAICVIAVAWLLASASIYEVMRQPPEYFGRVMSKIPTPVAFLVLPFETMWLHARSGTLHVGDSAPDFTLTKVDKSGQVQLSSFAAQGRPVVLVFGSYT